MLCLNSSVTSENFTNPSKWLFYTDSLNCVTLNGMIAQDLKQIFDCTVNRTKMQYNDHVFHFCTSTCLSCFSSARKQSTNEPFTYFMMIKMTLLNRNHDEPITVKTVAIFNKKTWILYLFLKKHFFPQSSSFHIDLSKIIPLKFSQYIFFAFP